MIVRAEFSQLTSDLARALAEILEAAENPSAEAVAIDVTDEKNGLWTVSVYFRSPPSKADLNALTNIAASSLEIEQLTWKLIEVPEVNWVQKSLEGLSPVRVGRFFVHGSHDHGLRPTNSIAIELEASMAFGSGHHGTTKGCLLAFDQLLKRSRPRRILDIGTGTGILAIAAAKSLKTRVIASDIDPVAVDHAKQNAHKNGVGCYLISIKSTGLNRHELKEHGPYDLVFANILAGPLARLAAPIRAITAPGAVVILSGILPEQSNLVESAYRAQGFSLRTRYKLEGWITLCLQS